MLALTLGLVIQSTPINVESPGIRLVNLIPKLASESRLTLSVVPYLENDVVAIRTMGRPWGEVKANLAKVLNATWEEKDGRLILAQTLEQQAADLATRYECMTAKIQKLKDDFEPYYSANEWTDREFATWFARKNKKFDPETKGMARLPEIVWRRRSDPNGRFIARFFHSATPEMFIQNGTEWYNRPYSDVPMALHHTISLDTRKMLQTYKDERERYELTKDQSTTVKAPTNWYKDSAHWKLNFLEEMDGKLSVSIDFLDSQGIYTDSVAEFGDYTDPSHYEGLRGKSKLSEFASERFSATNDKLGEYDTEVTKEDLAAQDKAKKLVQELCVEFAKSEVEDPLRYLSGDEWRLFSEEQSKPMIAFLADGIDNLVVMKSHPKLPSGLYRADAEGWIFGMQRDPLYVRSHRVPRPQLAKLMARLAVHTEVLNGDLANIEKELELGHLRFTTNLRWCPALDNVADAFVSLTSMGKLGDLYASLDAGLRRSLLAGQVLRIDRQSAETRRAFREIVYLGSGLYELDKRIPPIAFPAVDEGMLLTGRVGTESGYFLRYPDEVTNRIAPQLCFMDFDGLAKYFAEGDFDPKVEVATANRTTLNLELAFRQVTATGPRVEDSHWGVPRPTSKFTALRQLPQAFKSRLLERGNKLLKDDGR
ncbi:MAG: hypothetical protein WCK51_04385 [Armatimonadota bacterium]